MAVVSMKQLLEAGVHFGHQTRRWNPKMKRFIFGERNGIYIIDLNQTLARAGQAYEFVRDLVADGGVILFVGTKKQTQDPVARYAQACEMPYVNERWLGGMLTNFSTIHGRVRKMQEYERMRAAGDFENMPKKEALFHQRELDKLQRNLGGIRNMLSAPDAIFVIDTKKEHIAVTEANKLGIPVVAVVDTNCDPDPIQYVIPGNDDAIRSGTLLCRIIADAVTEGRFIAERRGGGSGPAPTTAPPRPPARLVTDEAPVAEAPETEAPAAVAAAAGEVGADPVAATPESVRSAEEDNHDSRHDPARNEPPSNTPQGSQAADEGPQSESDTPEVSTDA
ncbi:MAG TPA: 30S ribosomal protein S2 [Acidimicrobiales bacterium]|nr:30S ribosomal protein S2 [Acidimicrobiales bacterium]